MEIRIQLRNILGIFRPRLPHCMASGTFTKSQLDGHGNGKGVQGQGT